nr:RcnB family protein [Acidisphaera sp. S103]
MLIAPSFYYTGWAALGLQQPLPGYSWVRFGPDLLLVNLTTYEVEDVVYGVFQ